MNERIITTDACVLEGVAWLCTHEPRFAQIIDDVSPLPLRRKPDGFAELLSAIVSQQVSVASANAIWGRLKDAGMDTAVAVGASDEDTLRNLGLSRQKTRYAVALAQAGIDFETLRAAPTQDVIKTLTAVTGIGVWTAEIYAMFSLGRADVFAPGDLALQEGAKVLFELDERPTEKQLRVMAADWSPWRSVAARILWVYYAQLKTREGVR